MSYRFLLIFGLSASCSAAAFSAEPDPVAEWIEVDSEPSQTFTHSFSIDQPVQSARLRVGTSSVHLRLEVDGETTALVRAYDPLLDRNVPITSSDRRHEIRIIGDPVEGPSAFFVQLDLTLADGSRSSIISDHHWTDSSGQPARVLGLVERKLRVPAARRARVRATDNYEQWKLAGGDNANEYPVKFDLLPGFQIERVRQAKADEDSWVSMVFDPRGRLLIGKEKQGILRLTFAESRHEVTKVEHLANDLKECRGLTFIGDVLYANANESKTLYRLESDSERDGFADPETVLTTGGGTGHGRNDLTGGDDGFLYSIHGDAVDLPRQADVNSSVQDWTSPFRDARQGRRTREGHLIRVDPDSGQVDLLCAGLRNPFGVDFNRLGDAFTYDADAEFDMGSPWYRPTRVVHLVRGGDFGWRGVTGDWPPYYPDHPDNALPGTDIGKGSPTAVKFAYRSHFPAPFRDALFILDWAYGRVIAVHQVPRGSSYLMVPEVFLQGRPLNVTDLDFAADGSLYLITGGRQTQSALYRVWWTGEPKKARREQAKTAFESARAAYANELRTRRRRLEQLLLEPSSERLVDRAWESLGHPDPWVAHAAERLLERQPIESWQRRALTEADIQKAVPALLCLMRAPGPQRSAEVIRRLNDLFARSQTPLTQLPRTDMLRSRIKAFYTYWLALQAGDPIDPMLVEEIETQLQPLYPSSVPVPIARSENLWLSRILTQINADNVVPKSIRLLQQATDQSEQMHYLFTLRTVNQGWTEMQWLDYFAALRQAEGYLSGAGMAGFLQKIREEALESVADSYRASINKFLDASSPQTVSLSSQQREPVQHWKMDDFASTLADWEKQRPTEQRLRSGLDVFRSAGCVHCHRFGSEGTLLGPDLTLVGRRFAAVDLLSSILEPSKVIAQNYQSLQVLTRDGKTFTGQATMAGDYRTPELRLAVDPTKPLDFIAIPKAEIEAQQYSDVSWMPEGLLDTFTRQDIRDLVLLLRAGPISLETVSLNTDSP